MHAFFNLFLGGTGLETPDTLCWNFLLLTIIIHFAASKNVGQAGKRSLIRSGVIYAYPLSAVEEAYKGHVEMKEEQGVDRNTARRQFSASSDKTENLMKKVVGRALLHVHSPKDLNFTLNLSNEGSHASSTFSKNIVGVSTEMRSDKLLSKDVMDTQLTLTSEDCRQDQVVVSNGNFTVLQKGSLDEGLNNSRDEVFIYKKHCVKTFFMNKFGSQGDFLACLNCGACLAHTLYDLRDPGKKPITEGVTVRETAEHLYGKDVITEFFDIECGGPSVQDTQELQPLSNDDYVQNYSYSEFLQMQHQKGVKGTEMPFLSCLRIINLHTKAPVLRASKNVGQAARRSYSRHGAILCYRLSEMRESYRTHIKKLVKGNLPKRETGGGKRTHSELQETPAPVPSRQRQEVDTKRTKRSEFHSSGKMSSRLGSGLSLMIQEAVSPIAGIAGTC